MHESILFLNGCLAIGAAVYVAFLLGFHGRTNSHLESHSKAARRQSGRHHDN